VTVPIKLYLQNETEWAHRLELANFCSEGNTKEPVCLTLDFLEVRQIDCV
jgi:hypothetical protein